MDSSSTVTRFEVSRRNRQDFREDISDQRIQTRKRQKLNAAAAISNEEHVPNKRFRRTCSTHVVDHICDENYQLDDEYDSQNEDSQNGGSQNEGSQNEGSQNEESHNRHTTNRLRGARHTGSRRRFIARTSVDVQSDDLSDDVVQSSTNDIEHSKRISKIFACRYRKDTDNMSSSKDHTLEPCMEYLVKFEGESYRRLNWLTAQELNELTTDQVDQKLLYFHRRVGSTDVHTEIPLSSQDAGNFLLYQHVDRVIGVRLIRQKLKTRRNKKKKVNVSEETPQKKKEYLVKWRLLGYEQSTWEPEESLQSVEDQQGVQRFIQINTTFEFPTCVLPTDIRMMHGKHREESSTEPSTSNHQSNASSFMIKGESYTSEATSQHKGNTYLWDTFLKRKLAADGMYIPSIQRKTSNSLISEIVSARYLMSHQQEGIKWLFFNTEVNHHGSLLADEMGLGKTCQSIIFLEHLMDITSSRRSVGSHGLVIVQKSVLENWKREFQAWVPHLNVVAVCGGREDRRLIKQYEKNWMCPNTGKFVSAL